MAGSPEVRKNYLENLKPVRGLIIFVAGICLTAVNPSLGAVVAGAGLYLMHKDTQNLNH